MGRLLIQFPGTNTTKALSEILSKNVIIVDEDLHQLRLHDGVTPGGHIIGGSGGISNIDDLTITENADQEIQAVATVNQNTAAGATNPVYDWVGTLAEYQAQNIETLHPDWICYITDDVSGGASVYTKAQVDALLAAQAENNPGFCSYNTNTRIPISTTTQTATKNGWLMGSLWFSGSNVYFAIDVDGIEIIHSPWAMNNAWGVLNASIPIKAGQTYRYYGNGTMEQNNLYFYPNNE